VLVKDFFDLTKELISQEMEIMKVKGDEYTIGNIDKFQNFKSLAERLGTTPKQILMVYLLKHIDSICNYAITGKESSDEPIEGRIMDARNYLLLLAGLIVEEKECLKK
tara:strand:+ start:304 stop:627 length:324 start_codon:yes stop_codon:yes gene_type:complete